MTFSHFKAPTEPLFKQLKILRFDDQISINNCVLVHDYLKGKLPLCFDKTFSQLKNRQNIVTRNAEKGMLVIPTFKSTYFGSKSIYSSCITSWNMLTNKINNNEEFKGKIVDLKSLSRNKIKEVSKKYYLESYKEYIPTQWFQTKWFVSQTIEHDNYNLPRKLEGLEKQQICPNH